MRNASVIILVLLVCIFVPLKAHAKDITSFAETKAKINLGYFLPRFNTTLSVDPSNPALPAGELINLEDDLGLDKDQTLFRIDGYYRLGKRHRLQFGYFKLNRNAVRAISRQIEIGDLTFPLNAEITSSVSNAITEIGYMYSIIQSDQFELGVTFGVHNLDYSGQFTGDTGGGTIETTSSSGKGPLPLIGLDIDYAINPRWIFAGRAMVFAFDLDPFKGNLLDLKAALEYYYSNNMGVGLGLNRFDLDLDYDNSGSSGTFEWKYNGIQLYLTARL